MGHFRKSMLLVVKMDKKYNEEKVDKPKDAIERAKKMRLNWYTNTLDLNKGLDGVRAIKENAKISVFICDKQFLIFYT
jgi:hypothetical protein